MKFTARIVTAGGTVEERPFQGRVKKPSSDGFSRRGHLPLLRPRKLSHGLKLSTLQLLTQR
jgi:hypothetical protein